MTGTPTYIVTIAPDLRRYVCDSDTSLLEGAESLSAFAIRSGCRSGGCGICRIHIDHGQVKVRRKMSRAHVSSSEESEGYVLACRAYPLSDMTVSLAAHGRDKNIQGDSANVDS